LPLDRIATDDVHGLLATDRITRLSAANIDTKELHGPLTSISLQRNLLVSEEDVVVVDSGINVGHGLTPVSL
jgi:hypothetical protein